MRLRSNIGQPITQKESALLLNKDKNFYSHTKRNTPTLYRLMKMWGKGNIHQGAVAYFASVDNIREKLSKIYYELEICKSISRFWENTRLSNPYKTLESLISTLKANAFILTDRTMRFGGYRSSRKLIKLYAIWRESGFSEDQEQKIKELYA